jgi:hypothetical protein
MNISYAIAALVAISGQTPFAVQPETHAAPIIVKGRRISLATWSMNVSKSLEKELRYPMPSCGQAHREGIARVRFVCSQNGADERVVTGFVGRPRA